MCIMGKRKESYGGKEEGSTGRGRGVNEPYCYAGPREDNLGYNGCGPSAPEMSHRKNGICTSYFPNSTHLIRSYTNKWLIPHAPPLQNFPFLSIASTFVQHGRSRTGNYAGEWYISVGIVCDESSEKGLFTN